MGHEVLVVSISQSYHDNMTPLELYESTNFCWEIKTNNLKKIKYVLASYNGIIKEVYRVDNWVPAVENIPKTRNIKRDRNIERRYSFIGSVAYNIREFIINKPNFIRIYGSPRYANLEDIEEFYNFKFENNNLFEDIKNFIIDDKLEITEKENLIKCRLGQGEFRNKLIEYWNGCSVTKFNKIELLIASHIKPWSKSTNQERLDIYNGLLLMPNIDKVFDLGFISFNDNGRILISEQLTDYNLLGINSLMNIDVKEEHKKYLEYHRKYVFKN